MGIKVIVPVSVAEEQELPIVSTVYVNILEVVEVTFTLGVPEIVILLSTIDQLTPGGSPSTRADNAPPPNSYEIGNSRTSPSHKVWSTEDDPERSCKLCPFNTDILPVNASDSHPAVEFTALMLKL